MTTSYPLSPPAVQVQTASSEVCISLDRLLEEHGDFVWRTLRRLGVPEAQVDDATQQVLLVFANKIDRIQRGAEKPFLFVTMSHVAAHVRRSLARRREQPSDTTTELVDPTPGPDEVAQTRQARALLDGVLDAMPLDLRTVFVLAELEELTAPEIASMTGLALGTVASRLRRAREEFHKACKRLHAQQKTKGVR